MALSAVGAAHAPATVFPKQHMSPYQAKHRARSKTSLNAFAPQALHNVGAQWLERSLPDQGSASLWLIFVCAESMA